MINSRMLCLECLIDINENKKHSHLVINETLDTYQYLEKQDRAFISRVCMGTVERMIEIDYIINQFSKVKVNKMKPVIRNLLRMSVYQLKYMDSIPSRAVCNEAVKIATKKGFHTLKGFVNGVLRNIDRNLDNIEYPQKDTIEYMEIYYSMPRWIIEKWIEDYGREITICILDGLLKDDNTVSIRCNTDVTTVDDLEQILLNEVELVKKSKYCKEGFIISGYNYLSKLQSFKDGLFYVQDESSMIDVDAMGVRDGDYVVDVCSAPGGKAIGAALKLHGTGMVDARDISEYKVELINDNIERVKIDNIKTKVFDAMDVDKEIVNKADVVIADLPCSGLGVIGKKTDIKYNVSDTDLDELQGLQRNILEVIKCYVKPGGILLYSTCTINKGENEDNVKWFLENNKEFKLESLKPYVSKELSDKSIDKGYLQLLPGVHDTDGFFMARLRKIN